MNLRRKLLVALCAASLGIAAAPITAGAETAIYFSVAPPPARHEAVPAPRRGYEWSPGYWNVRGQRHVWQAGHWERTRAGHYYSQPTWTQHGEHWQLERGRWNQGDRDHDGVPNAVDRAPDNPRLR
jgi:hypothetical protein